MFLFDSELFLSYAQVLFQKNVKNSTHCQNSSTDDTVLLTFDSVATLTVAVRLDEGFEVTFSGFVPKTKQLSVLKSLSHEAHGSTSFMLAKKYLALHASITA